MNRMKRWTMSVTSWVDGVLAQVENHEAAVGSAIAHVRKSTAEARVRLRRVERDVAQLRDTLATEHKAVAAWRARAAGADDDDQAIECLRRHKAAQARVVRLEARLREQEHALKQLHEGVRRLRGRLAELNERKNLMRARQSRAEAVHGVSDVAGPIVDLEDIFDRWESRVGEIEICSDDTEPVEPFEAELLEKEERSALAAELEALRAGQD